MRAYQCRFRRGAERTVAWIEARGAKVGAWVDLETLDDGGLWEVEAVFDAPLEDRALKEMQRLNRKSLSSLMKTRCLKRRPVMAGYEEIEGARAPIKAWVKGVPMEHEAQTNCATSLHCRSSILAHRRDAGRTLRHRRDCGLRDPDQGRHYPGAGRGHRLRMMAVRNSRSRQRSAGPLSRLRGAIERNVPHGNGPNGNHRDTPFGGDVLPRLRPRRRYRAIIDKHPKASAKLVRSARHLGGGNHFIEVCLDEEDRVWVMLHSARVAGNAIGNTSSSALGRIAEARTRLPRAG